MKAQVWIGLTATALCACGSIEGEVREPPVEPPPSVEHPAEPKTLEPPEANLPTWARNDPALRMIARAIQDSKPDGERVALFCEAEVDPKRASIGELFDDAPDIIATFVIGERAFDARALEFDTPHGKLIVPDVVLAEGAKVTAHLEDEDTVSANDGLGVVHGVVSVGEPIALDGDGAHVTCRYVATEVVERALADLLEHARALVASNEAMLAASPAPDAGQLTLLELNRVLSRLKSIYGKRAPPELGKLSDRSELLELVRSRPELAHLVGEPGWRQALYEVWMRVRAGECVARKCQLEWSWINVGKTKRQMACERTTVSVGKRVMARISVPRDLDANAESSFVRTVPGPWPDGDVTVEQKCNDHTFFQLDVVR